MKLSENFTDEQLEGIITDKILYYNDYCAEPHQIIVDDAISCTRVDDFITNELGFDSKQISENDRNHVKKLLDEKLEEMIYSDTEYFYI